MSEVHGPGVDESRLFLAAVVESSHDSIVTVDFDGLITTWNKAAEQLYGYSKEEAVGQVLVHLTLPHDLDEVLGNIEKIKHSQKVEVFESIRTHKGGREIHLEVVMSPVHDESGHLLGVSTIARDVTAKQLLQRELQETRARLEKALTAGNIGTWEYDIAANRINADANFASFFNISPEDARGGPLENYLRAMHPDDVAAVAVRLTCVLESGESYEAEYRVIAPDGAVRWIATRGKAEKNALGVTVRLSGVALDMTLRHQAEEALRQAHQQAEQTNRIKDEFLATLSHELRTPLNAILGWSNILRTNELDRATQQQGLETIERNARSQAQLIEDLLDVSRILTGKVRLDLRPLELCELLTQAVNNTLPSAQTKNLRLETHIDESVGLISGDPDRLGQVLWNLLSNAIKFTPKNGFIRVAMERLGSQVQIQISDSGQGIAPEFLPFVFERFRQADASTTREFGGLGIGLALVRHLTEAHGGTVSVESAGKGQGATFSLRFPLMAVRPMPVVEAASRQKIASLPFDAAPETGTLPLSGLRLLVVDDEADARTLLQVALTQGGAQVELAESAQNAFVLITGVQRPFDVLVSDIGMPHEDGHSLVRHLRAWETDKGVFLPAIALTAYVSPKARLDALRAGFQAHIAKPVDARELVVTIASLTRRNGR